LQKEAESFFSSFLGDLPEGFIGLTPEDWFDSDELDRDLTPLIEQQTAETKPGLKVALKARKEPGQQKLAGPVDKEGSA